MDQRRFYSGQLLLALPGIGDQRFEKAVIALCSHDEQGALGIGIGRVLPRLTLHVLLKQLKIDPGVLADVPVYQGGPVEPQRGFVLHSLDWGGSDSLQVTGKWGLTSTLDILRALAAGKGPKSWLVAMGYAGWSAGQLDREMTYHGWHLVEASEALIFSTTVENRWASAFKSDGIDPSLLSGVSGTA
ncbi:MAG: hypothetical protein RIS52_2622 [Pseudomonadota bacterium]|jgi:putative transcriptional regulator